MSDPDPDRALLTIAHELDAVGRRLTELSAALATLRTSAREGLEAAEPEPAPQPEPETAPEESSYEPVSQTAARDAHGEPGHDADAGPEPAEQWAGNRVLAWIGAAVTLVGVVFLLVMAVRNDWLGPSLRVVAGLVLGAGLVAAGFRAHRRPAGGIGGYALAATGFAVLYLDAVAATSLYGYLPVTGGLAVGLLVAVGGLLLADRWRAQPLAVAVVVGCAVCAPLITQRPSATLVGFLLLLQVAAAPVQLRQGWRVLTSVSCFPAVLAALIGDVWGLTLADQRGVVAASGAVAVVGVLSAAVTARLRPSDVGTAVAVLVASPIPALLAAPLLDREAAGYLAGGVAVSLLGLWAQARRAGLLPSRFVATTGGLGIVAALQATMTFLDSSVWASVLLGQALLLSLVGLWLRSRGPLVGALPYTFIGLCVALDGDLSPRVLLDESGSGGSGLPGVLVGLVLAAVVAVGTGVAVRLGALPAFPRAWAAWLSAGVALLYASSATTMTLVLLVADDRDGFLVGHVLITLSWVLAAIGLLLRGVDARHLRVPGMVLLAVALTKLFLFDLATLDGFARVVAFLCAGLVLLTAGARYARLIGRSENQRPTPVETG